MTQSNRFIPVSEWNNFYPWPTQGSIRVRICHAEKGRGDPEFLTCILRIGRRVLIDESKFIKWVRQHRVNDWAELHEAT